MINASNNKRINLVILVKVAINSNSSFHKVIKMPDQSASAKYVFTEIIGILVVCLGQHVEYIDVFQLQIMTYSKIRKYWEWQ